LDFQFLHGSVATYCRWGGNLCDVYIENFLTNHLVKDFWKSVHISRKQTWYLKMYSFYLATLYIMY